MVFNDDWSVELEVVGYITYISCRTEGRPVLRMACCYRRRLCLNISKQKIILWDLYHTS